MKEYYITWWFGLTEKVSELSYAFSKTIETNDVVCAWKITFK